VVKLTSTLWAMSLVIQNGLISQDKETTGVITGAGGNGV